MSTINGVLVPGQVTTAGLEPAAQTTSESSGPVTLMPDPALTQLSMMGDPGAMVAALVVETAQGESSIARQSDTTESNIQDQQEKAQVAAMHQKATDMRMDALTSGVMGVCAGAISLVGSTYDGGEAKALEADSKLMSTGRDIVSQLGKANEADDDGNIATFEHNAAHASRAASQAYDTQRDAQKLLDSALDFLREYMEASEQAKAATAHAS